MGVIKYYVYVTETRTMVVCAVYFTTFRQKHEHKRTHNEFLNIWDILFKFYQLLIML